MRDEFAARQRAIKLRLGGRPVRSICQALGRSEFWFHKWWRRYLESGAEGLYDLTHATHHVAQRIAPELERTILSIRRRLQAHAAPATRYRLIGAPAILAELCASGEPLLAGHVTIAAWPKGGVPWPNPYTGDRAGSRTGGTSSPVGSEVVCPSGRSAGPRASTR